MFDENIIFRTNLDNKILAGHLVACHFGQNQSISLVAISQTLDKLVVHETSSVKLGHAEGPGEQNKQNEGSEFSLLSPFVSSPDSHQPPVHIISVKDVIRTISVKSFTTRVPILNCDQQPPNSKIADDGEITPSTSVGKLMPMLPKHIKDLLLIGCTHSILIYDTMSQTNLLNINTSAVTNVISMDYSSLATTGAPFQQQLPVICGGQQKIYAFKLDFHPDNNNFNLDAEISSERSTSDTISCLIQGQFNRQDLVITGSVERKLRIYFLDLFDYNIQACKLTIEEGSQINCLFPIYTDCTTTQNISQNESQVSRQDSLLPPVNQTNDQLAGAQASEQMNYFAYGLENGIIGVYRLLMSVDSTIDNSLASAATTTGVIATERLWRHRSKQVPLTIMMYDIDGDGQDELLIGFKNSRLEARSPFTGQLLATTRCFKSSDRLVGLVTMSLEEPSSGQQIANNSNGSLVACSTYGSLVGFKPPFQRSRRPLRGFSVPSSSLARSKNSRQLDSQPSDDWTTSLAAAHASLLADTMEGTTDLGSMINETTTTLRDESMVARDNLHIELNSDNTRPSKCDAKQSSELLQRVSVLQNEQMELERKACQVYHATMHQTQASLDLNGPTSANISHCWDFDYATVSALGWGQITRTSIVYNHHCRPINQQTPTRIAFHVIRPNCA